MQRFRKFNSGDKLTANTLNRIADSLPKYDNITTNGTYTDCGNGQVIIRQPAVINLADLKMLAYSKLYFHLQ